METIISALALMLIFEGLGPALLPKQWRNYLLQLAEVDEKILRRVGVTLILVGAIIFHFVRA